jgi:hypothetical protein
MPSDVTGDDIGAPDPPRLCPDHRPVIGNAKHLEGVDHLAAANARAEYARQCPLCYPLNRRTLL